jgi:hypothetical protein
MRHLGVEVVKVVTALGHLTPNVLLSIPNAKLSVVDLHARTTLIQPLILMIELHSMGDVEDLGDESVLTSLGDEDDKADALDVDARRIIELDGAPNVGVKVGEGLPTPGHVVRRTIV